MFVQNRRHTATIGRIRLLPAFYPRRALSHRPIAISGNECRYRLYRRQTTFEKPLLIPLRNRSSASLRNSSYRA